MASPTSEIDPAAEPHFVVVIEEPSSAGGSEGEAPAAAEVVVEKEAVEGETKAEEEEEGECGFCLYMKAGGCKEVFVSWEQCVEAAQKEGTDMVERCSEATTNLKKCMDAHPDYYGILLQAEQVISDEAEAAADADRNKGEESAPSLATDETKKEETVVESAASAAGAKEEVVEQAASSMAVEEAKKEEAVVEKVESLSLGN